MKYYIMLSDGMVKRFRTNEEAYIFLDIIRNNTLNRRDAAKECLESVQNIFYKCQEECEAALKAHIVCSEGEDIFTNNLNKHLVNDNLLDNAFIGYKVGDNWRDNAFIGYKVDDYCPVCERPYSIC